MLKGTEKQIKWAEGIRTKIINDLSLTIDKFNKNEKTSNSNAGKKMISKLENLKSELNLKSSSSFWIKIKNTKLNNWEGITHLMGNSELSIEDLNDSEDRILMKMFNIINREEC